MKKAVFLDRDGTINVEKHYLFRIEDFEYIDGAVEGLRALSDIGYLLVIVTNQSGIARGYYTEQDYKKLDDWIKKDLEKKGVVIAGSYYCPHLLSGSVKEYVKDCDCRKPKTGLFWKAAKELGIDMAGSFAIGDKIRDLSICEESDVTGILFTDATSVDSKYYQCKNWNEAVDVIKRTG